MLELDSCFVNKLPEKFELPHLLPEVKYMRLDTFIVACADYEF